MRSRHFSTDSVRKCLNFKCNSAVRSYTRFVRLHCHFRLKLLSDSHCIVIKNPPQPQTATYPGARRRRRPAPACRRCGRRGTRRSRRRPSGTQSAERRPCTATPGRGPRCTGATAWSSQICKNYKSGLYFYERRDSDYEGNLPDIWCL